MIRDTMIDPVPDTDERRVARFRRSVRELLADVEELPSRADDFASSVTEKANAILETVERTGRVTDRQEGAIARMANGVGRWLHR